MPDLSSIYSQDDAENVKNGAVLNDLGNGNGNKNTIQFSTDNDIELSNNLIIDPHSNKSMGQFIQERSKKHWINDIFRNSAIYSNNDPLLWGPFIIVIFKDPETNNICSITLDKLGITLFNKLDISKNSRFYPAIENLPPNEQTSNVRKSIAVSLLRKFSSLTESQIKMIAPQGLPLKFDYDQIHAGELASNCNIFTKLTPERFGERLVQSGLLSKRLIRSILVDVIYENNDTYIDANNKLVFHLGEQLEQLFDPIREYSPEQTEYNYKPPDSDPPTEDDGPLVQQIINELLQFQSNFTFNLVEFLQKVIITLRVRVLNDEIEGLSTIKLNRLFPPTIDEVTRINCIFLDSLKAAVPYGSLEVLRACSLTIPYFYKAYTRHEAASKNFNKDIKLFLRNFHDILPENDHYTELKLETLIKGPQEKLIKLKLIIDRLWKNKKKWANPSNANIAQREYNNIIDVIDSFGKLDRPMNSYNTRVFTPSGKILTELAKGWPVELQYKWLKRRVVGVYDIINKTNKYSRQVLVIFSDYVVFLSIPDFETYYTTDTPNKPLISDILMNSLVNEVPLPPKIPKLQVEHYCYIDKIFVSIFDDDCLRFDALKGDDSFSITCQIATPKSNSATYIADLITKAKILEKDTAFHLFKASHKEDKSITLYSTAHEIHAYNDEKIKSPFAMFLNIEPSKKLLEINNLQVAIFAKFVKEAIDEEVIQFDILSSTEKPRTITLNSNEIIDYIISNASHHAPYYYSSIDSTLNRDLMTANLFILNEIQKNNDEPLITSDDDNNNNPDLMLKQVTTENKQSYATLTTFRSNVSDLKLSEKANKKKSKEEQKQASTDKAQKPVIEKKKTKKMFKTKEKPKSISKKSNAKPVVQNKSKEKKKNSFFGTIKNIFSSNNNNKRKSQIISDPVAAPQPKDFRRERPNTQSIATPTSERKIKGLSSLMDSRRTSKINSIVNVKDDDPMTSSKPVDTTDIKEKTDQASDAEQQRISSVVRNTDFQNKLPTSTEQKVIPKESIAFNAQFSQNTIPNEVPMAVVPPPESPKKGLPAPSQPSHGYVPFGSNVVDNINIAPDHIVITKPTIESYDKDEQSNPTTNAIKDSNERIKDVQINRNDTSHMSVETRDIINKTIAGDLGTQSQVFNDDLFGDFVDNIPTVKKVHQNEEVLQPKDTQIHSEVEHKDKDIPDSKKLESDSKTGNEMASSASNRTDDTVQDPKIKIEQEEGEELHLNQNDNGKDNKKNVATYPDDDLSRANSELSEATHSLDENIKIKKEETEDDSNLLEENTEISKKDRKSSEIDTNLDKIDNDNDKKENDGIKVKMEDTDDNYDIFGRKKNQIFPVIPPVSKPKTHQVFERSPSFIELFQGMRVVLDDNDAKYNWRKLPSSSSLNEDSLIDPKATNHAHIYRNFVSKDHMPPVDEIPPEDIASISNRATDNTKNTTKDIIEDNGERSEETSMEHEKKKEHKSMGALQSPPHISEQGTSSLTNNNRGRSKEINDSVITEDTSMLENEVHDVVQSMFSNNQKSLPPKSPNSFKIINTSPTRYVDRSAYSEKTVENNIINNAISSHKDDSIATPSIAVATDKPAPPESHMEAEFSLPSEINSDTDKRKSEKSFKSNDNITDTDNVDSKNMESLLDKRYESASENASEVFVDAKNNSTVLSLQREKDNTSIIDYATNDDSNNFSVTSKTPSDSNEIDTTHDNDDTINNIVHSPASVKANNPVSMKSSDLKTGSENDSLLDDLDFSSFHMTFDSSMITNNQDSTSNILNQESADNSQNIAPAAGIWNNIPNLPPTRKGPVVYRLSRDMLSGLSVPPNDVVSTEQEEKEGDPFWVSPSKIDFTDLTRTSPAKEASSSTNWKSLENNHRNTNMDRSTSDSSALVGDASFAFLGDYVDADVGDNKSEDIDDVNYLNDKPQRLQFI